MWHNRVGLLLRFGRVDVGHHLRQWGRGSLHHRELHPGTHGCTWRSATFRCVVFDVLLLSSITFVLLYDLAAVRTSWFSALLLEMSFHASFVAAALLLSLSLLLSMSPSLVQCRKGHYSIRQNVALTPTMPRSRSIHRCSSLCLSRSCVYVCVLCVPLSRPFSGICVLERDGRSPGRRHLVGWG